MPDLSSVEDGLVKIIADAIFTAPYTPYTIATSPVLNNAPIRLFRGWPVNDQLEKDLLADVTSISVFSMPGVSKDTTRFLRQMAHWAVSRDTPTMTATVLHNTVTFAGTAIASQVIGVAIIPTAGFSYRLTNTDTPTSVAAIFAANLPNASSSGPVLTLNTAKPIRADIGTDTTTLTEVRRQSQMFQITIWAPTVELRDRVANYIDPALSYVDHMLFAEGSASGPIRAGNGTVVDDVVQKQRLWKRTLFYNIEYPTMFIEVKPTMVLGSVDDGGPIFYE